MRDEDLKTLRELCAAATPGPWGVEDQRGTTTLLHPTDVPTVDGWALVGRTIHHRDAAFIAAARSDVPALLDEIDRLSRTVDRKDEQLAEAQEANDRLRRALEATSELEDLTRQHHRGHVYGDAAGEPGNECRYCEAIKRIDIARAALEGK